MSPTPSITSLSPSAVPPGKAVTITISGSGFEANSGALWNGSARPTTFVGGTSLQVALTAADVQNFGTGQITVNNPGPGGSATGAMPLGIVGSPAITSLAPASVNAGAAAQTLTLTGFNFNSTSVVALDGVALPTTFVNTTTLQAALTVASLASGRAGAVMVTNSDPNGGVSAAATFNIVSPTPIVTAINPAAIVVGGPAVTIMLAGTGFEANSVVQWNGSARQTTFASSTSLLANLTADDLQRIGVAQITVSNPRPGGGASPAVPLPVVGPPVLTSVTPTALAVAPAATPATVLTLTGSNFAANATVTANGTALTITAQTSTQITASLPTSFLASSGTVYVVVVNPPTITGATPLSSFGMVLSVLDPTASFTVSPNYAPAGSPDTKITLYGQGGFFPDTVVQWNGTPLVTSYTSSSQIVATVPAALIATLGTASIGISAPENLGQAPPVQPFSTYLALPVNDIAWSAKDSLIYATIAGSGGPSIGNSLIGIDPNTGVIQKTIFVGSEPNRLALSDDGTQAFVGLDGIGAVRQVNLQTGTAGVQFSLGGGPGVYNPPFTAKALAIPPGQPNAVAVYSSAGVVTIFDSGVARTNTSSGLQTYFTSNVGGLAFGDSASTLYVSSEAIGSYLYKLSVDTTGVTGITQLSTSGSGSTLQYDNGRLYFPSGIAADATTGATLGQFSTASSYSTTPVPASGAIFSDSTLNRAFVLLNNYTNTGQIQAFDETTFNPVASLAVAGVGVVNSYSSSGSDLIRWGQTGLAFHASNQLYVVQGPIVKDVSASPADLKVTAQVATTASTGSNLSYQFTVSNTGPNAAVGATLILNVPGSVPIGAVTSSQGTCTGSGVLYCDLGSLANNATATVTFTGVPSLSGTIETIATAASQSFDPAMNNNRVTADTVVTGSLFSAQPSVTQLAPNFVAAGGATFTVTVNGSGFSSASSVLWNGSALPTTFVSATQLTATVDTSLIKTMGWGQVTVSSAAPGGGLSGSLTVSVYNLLNLPATAMTYDAFTRKLYTTLPSTATSVTGNSLAAVDPATGVVGTPISVGSEPNLLAETTSGNYLYIGLSGAKSLGRFNLKTQTLDLTVPLQSTSYFGSGPAAATGLAAVPGTDSAVAATGVGVIDFAGTTATVRTNSDPGLNNVTFADATHFYTYDNQSTGAEFYRYSLDSSGIHPIDGTTLLGFGGFGGTFALDRGLVYASGGGIIDPSTTPPSQVGLLPLGVGPYSTGLYGAGVIPYAAEQKSFNIGINTAGTALTFLERFDDQHFVMEDELQFPSSNIGSGVIGTRWGQDGLAYILPASFGSTVPNQILLLRGPFVLPAEGTTNPAPSLTSTGTTTIAVGSGNQTLTLTGSGFLPGATVLWNGTVLSTTWVDAQHLTAAVGAQDVNSAATVSITCRNPGSTDSSALTLSVQ
ncbi:hypothetical protein GRAN_1247 [Granulicella sibirica]|uniref:DUF11 domain-containing protein n=2 Tax=Granulicella sibirica TaxID=2479048 RepID=A0A4Q0T3R5_9BACT|nr:hypothetical protein GRAN_1247 [Granulicella sibirica]